MLIAEKWLDVSSMFSPHEKILEDGCYRFDQMNIFGKVTEIDHCRDKIYI